MLAWIKDHEIIFGLMAWPLLFIIGQWGSEVLSGQTARTDGRFRAAADRSAEEREVRLAHARWSEARPKRPTSLTPRAWLRWRGELLDWRIAEPKTHDEWAQINAW